MHRFASPGIGRLGLFCCFFTQLKILWESLQIGSSPLKLEILFIRPVKIPEVFLWSFHRPVEPQGWRWTEMGLSFLLDLFFFLCFLPIFGQFTNLQPGWICFFFVKNLALPKNRWRRRARVWMLEASKQFWRVSKSQTKFAAPRGVLPSFFCYGGRAGWSFWAKFLTKGPERPVIN